MDCPSEERLIRLKLAETNNIQSLQFDLSERKLLVFHTGSHEEILTALENLNLDTKLVFSEPVDAGPVINIDHQDRSILWKVLIINLFFFALELLAGFIGGSMGLVADSLDMLADSIVYALSLFAVGGNVSRKKKVAAAAGYFQFFLAFIGIAEVVRRYLGHGETPDFYMMIIISLLALLGNASCLYLLQKSESREAHMKASMIFTSNDVIVNLGVILAGVLVFLTGSKLPDLTIGAIVFMIVGAGAHKILQLSK